MNQVQAIKSLKMDSWFLDQLQIPGSAPEKFYWNFLLKFSLENLKKEQRKKFLNLLASQKSDEALEYIFTRINDFEKRFSRALGERLNKIKKTII